jgi:hypothetical protein
VFGGRGAFNVELRLVKPRYLTAATIVWLLVIALAVSHTARWLIVGIGILGVLLFHHRTNRRLRTEVQAKCRELRDLPFDDLAAMESSGDGQTDITDVGLRLAQIDVLVKHSGTDSLRVRGSMEVLFYVLLSFDGFYAAPDGRVWPIRDSEFEAIEAEFDAYDSEPH